MSSFGGFVSIACNLTDRTSSLCEEGITSKGTATSCDRCGKLLTETGNAKGHRSLCKICKDSLKKHEAYQLGISDAMANSKLFVSPSKKPVTKEMISAGSKVATDIMAAHIAYAMEGLGGGPSWTDWLAEEVPNQDLCIAYAKDEVTAVEAIYIAMNREALK